MVGLPEEVMEFYAGNYRNGLKVGLHGGVIMDKRVEQIFKLVIIIVKVSPKVFGEILTLGMIVFRKTRMGIMKRFIVLAAM